MSLAGEAIFPICARQGLGMTRGLWGRKQFTLRLGAAALGTLAAVRAQTEVPIVLG